MISLVLLIYIGVQIGAPSWYFWFCGIIGFAKIISFGISIGKTLGMND